MPAIDGGPGGFWCSAWTTARKASPQPHASSTAPRCGQATRSSIFSSRARCQASMPRLAQCTSASSCLARDLTSCRGRPMRRSRAAANSARAVARHGASMPPTAWHPPHVAHNRTRPARVRSPLSRRAQASPPPTSMSQTHSQQAQGSGGKAIEAEKTKGTAVCHIEIPCRVRARPRARGARREAEGVAGRPDSLLALCPA